MIVYVASSKLAGATSGGTVPAPTGVAENDVMVALASAFGGATPPSGLAISGGWEKLAEVVQSGVPTNQYTTALFVRRAGASEPASYTLSGTGTGNWRLAVVAAYRGCRTTGAPYDDFTLAPSSGAYSSAVAHSITALTKDCRLVWAESNEQGDPHTPPEGYVERIDAEASLADAEKAIEGPSGAIIGTISAGVYTVAGLVALASEPEPEPTPDDRMEYGFIRAADRRLVVVEGAVDHVDQGLPRDAAGRLVVTTGEGDRFDQGFLRDADGRLVVVAPS